MRGSKKNSKVVVKKLLLPNTIRITNLSSRGMYIDEMEMQHDHKEGDLS